MNETLCDRGSQIDVSVGPARGIPPIDEKVNEMSELVWILIAVLVVAALVVVGWSLSRRRRSTRLKEHFGPEYERTVGELGEQRAAEAELVAREKKRKKLDIVDLTPEARQSTQRPGRRCRPSSSTPRRTPSGGPSAW